jgi:hypothetical protein
MSALTAIVVFMPFVIIAAVVIPVSLAVVRIMRAVREASQSAASVKSSRRA